MRRVPWGVIAYLCALAAFAVGGTFIVALASRNMWAVTLGIVFLVLMAVIGICLKMRAKYVFDPEAQAEYGHDLMSGDTPDPLVREYEDKYRGGHHASEEQAHTGEIDMSENRANEHADAEHADNYGAHSRERASNKR